MRVCGFGTYDGDRHPRVRVLLEGLHERGAEVTDCNVPLGVATAARVRLLKQPWRVPTFLTRVVIAWIRLWRQSRRMPAPDVVVVGYLGHLDVHLARMLWSDAVIVLDHLISLEDTAIDRATGPGWMLRWLARLDRASIRAADVICVDTEEHLDLVPPDHREDAVVVPVGAPSDWFHAVADRVGDPLRIAFFGLYTPLQGAPVVGEAIGILADDERLAFTMIGTGQDLEATRSEARANPRVEWVRWVDPQDLPGVVASHDVCLGIFGTGPKSLRVIPNKVYQGAAAGCAVVTSDTAPQRRTLGDGAAYVAPGDARHLAETLADLARSPERVAELQKAASERASVAFAPVAAVASLWGRLSAEDSAR